MRAVAALPIELGKPVTLAPDGYHIMLMRLKQALKEGDSFPVALNFAKAGQATATATVPKAGATMPGMDVGGMGNMPRDRPASGGHHTARRNGRRAHRSATA